MKPRFSGLLPLLSVLMGGVACSPEPPSAEPQGQDASSAPQGQDDSSDLQRLTSLAARALADEDVRYDDLAETFVIDAVFRDTGMSVREAQTQNDLNVVFSAQQDLWFSALDAWRDAAGAAPGGDFGSVSGKVAAVRADCGRIFGRSWEGTGSGEPMFRAGACIELVRQRLRAWDPSAARAGVWERLRNARLELEGSEIVLDDGLSPVFSAPDDWREGGTVERRIRTEPDWCVRDASGADWMVCESDLADGEDLSGDWQRLWAIRFEGGVPGEPRRIAEDVSVSNAALELDPDGVPVFVCGASRLRTDGR